MSLALVAFLPQLEEQRANLHRQHVCCILHKSPGWRVLQSRFHAGCKPPMGGLSFTFHQSSAHSRSSKPRSGHAFEEWNSSGGVETSSRLSSNNLALPAALLAVSCPADGGCSDIALTKSQTSRVNILPLVLCKIKEERALVIFIALNWSNQPWFPDLREIQIWLPLGEFPSGGTCCLK